MNRETKAEAGLRLWKHWKHFANPGMTEREARAGLRHCLDCWEIGGRVLFIFGIRLDRTRMPA